VKNKFKKNKKKFNTFQIKNTLKKEPSNMHLIFCMLTALMQLNIARNSIPNFCHFLRSPSPITSYNQITI
jgi:hypothetical protein